MNSKRIVITAGIVAVVITGGLYFVVPSIARGVIKNKITNDSKNTVGDIQITWGGPQAISTLHVEDTFGTADVDVTISNSLFSLVTASSPIEVLVLGSASVETTAPIDTDTIAPTLEDEIEPSGSLDKKSTAAKTIPAIKLALQLDNLTINGDEPIHFTELKGTLDIDPGMHFSVALETTSETGGEVTIECSAPNFLTKSGEFNWDTSANSTLRIVNTPIPTMNGVGGWSVLELDAEFSSPNVRDAINISINGSLAEYDTPRGSVVVKAQLVKSDAPENMFMFDGKEVVGTIDLTDVPTTILDPFLNAVKIDTAKCFGPTMDLHVQRSKQGPPLVASFVTQEVQADGTVDSNNGRLSDVTIVANLQNDLLQQITDKQFSGEAIATIHIDQLAPVGISDTEKPECIAQISIDGSIEHLQSKTTISSLQCNVIADVRKREISTNGFVIIDKFKSVFDVALNSTHKNKLDGIDDLWKTITRQLPQGTGVISIVDFPTKVAQAYITDKRIKLQRELGKTATLNIKLKHHALDFDIAGNRASIIGAAQLKGTAIESLSGITANATISKALAKEFVGIDKEATISAHIKNLDMDGNSTFNATVVIEKQNALLQGTTSRNDDNSLDAHVAATGIPTQYINPFLADTIGSPLAVECIAKNILNKPIIVAGGTAPNAAFETSLVFANGKISTVKKTTTRADLTLSTSLTKRLLKDLGPVLSDIHSVKRPIIMTVNNASAALNNDVSTLKADIVLDIGEVMLDNGSVTLNLLSLFNTKHKEHIPATFEPIHIQIRKGIVKYKEFHLTLANKYSIPYAGTINLVNRTLKLHSTVPLTGLGYSIKELRGLATDIDVPILITGTIDKPIVKVDPKFDIGKLLQSAALDSLGESIGDILGGGNKGESPNPLDILDELFK
ncbi:MAG: hypothetical protein H8E86_05620 [Planctomycetes bacterium]|nr:hypothetical protein [Planctomycetota bacterium]